MGNKPSYQDFKEGTPQELKKVYKLDDRKLEQAYRDHLVGANRTETKREYHEFYGKR